MRSISFLVPVYNKELTIAQTVELLVKTGNELSLECEVVVVDDGSRDNSWKEILELKERFKEINILENGLNIGFAKSYITAAKMATKSYVMYVSADNDLPRETLVQMIFQLGQKEVVILHSSAGAKRTLVRKFISWLYTASINFILGKKIKYYNGQNIYPADFVKNHKLTNTSFSFQAELLLEAIKKYEYQTVEGVVLHDDKFSSAFKVENIIGVARFLMSLIGKRIRGCC